MSLTASSIPPQITRLVTKEAGRLTPVHAIRVEFVRVMPDVSAIEVRLVNPGTEAVGLEPVLTVYGLAVGTSSLQKVGSVDKLAATVLEAGKQILIHVPARFPKSGEWLVRVEYSTPAGVAARDPLKVAGATSTVRTTVHIP